MTGDGDACVVGIDFGTLSGRAVVVRARDGAELGAAVQEYRHGVMDTTLAATGEPLPPDWALQDPEDYRRRAPPARCPPPWPPRASIPPWWSGSAPTSPRARCCPRWPTGRRCASFRRLAGAAARLPEAVEAPRGAAAGRPDQRAGPRARTSRGSPATGGRSRPSGSLRRGCSCWRRIPLIYQQTSRWIEAADWIIWQLTGVETRNACTAGYKGIWQDGRYPSREFLAALHPRFATFAADKLGTRVMPLGARAGSLTAQAAAWTGLPEGIAVAVGNVDAHVTAPAAAAIAPGQMVAIMGTSTCHVMNGAKLAEVPGHVRRGRRRHRGRDVGLRGRAERRRGHLRLVRRTRRARRIPSTRRSGAACPCTTCCPPRPPPSPPGAHGLIALDWLNGNRSVLVDHHLSGAIVGLTLATRAPGHLPGPGGVDRVRHPGHHRRVRLAGVPVTELVIAGGLTKNEFVLQIYADVTRRPLSLISSEQGPALGSAIHAAVAAGCLPRRPGRGRGDGRQARGGVPARPGQRRTCTTGLYAEYLLLHDYFGRGGNEVMHRLRGVRDRPWPPRAAGAGRGLAKTEREEAPRGGTGRWAGARAAGHGLSAWPGCGAPSATCTPTWSRRAWWPGPRATSRPGFPARTSW